ncbi:MAG TPA: TenA family protein [Baekduia sp.]|nr:TenA family protein [Baekduia sp.]
MTTGVVQEWWDGIAKVRAAIDELPFILGLGDGTLDRDAFLWFLAQDALYLRAFARALSEASRLAPTTDEAEFWEYCAKDANAGELELHESWLGAGTTFDAAPNLTTRAYTRHLDAAAATGSYLELIAALLPCFWIYYDVGVRLLARSFVGHPYASWLDTYSDPSFEALNSRAVAVVSERAGEASDAERDLMKAAFDASARHELEFFAAPLKH